MAGAGRRHPLPRAPWALVLVLLALAALRGAALLSHPSTEFDEGVYLTTFRLAADRPLYGEVFHSQLPGFYLAVGPVFAAFGRTLEAGRLAVLLWSLAGLAALVWLEREAQAPGSGLAACALLYLMPAYRSETLSFHSSLLPSTFSALALASAFRRRRTGNDAWLHVAVAFLAAAFLAKADVAAALPCLLASGVLEAGRGGPPRPGRLLAPLATGAAVLALGLAPFGARDVLSQVFGLRLAASHTSAYDPVGLLRRVLQERGLREALAGGLLLAVLAWRRRASPAAGIAALAAWPLCALAVLVLDRPLLPHHIVFLALPSAALAAAALSWNLDRSGLGGSFPLLAALAFALVLGGRLGEMMTTSRKIASEDEDKAIAIVNRLAGPGDSVVSDDGLVTGLTGRLPPPFLCDLSAGRVTWSLSPERFESELADHRPKLILDWTGRLRRLPGFEDILARRGYRLAEQVDPDHRAFLLSR